VVGQKVALYPGVFLSPLTSALPGLSMPRKKKRGNTGAGLNQRKASEEPELEELSTSQILVAPASNDTVAAAAQQGGERGRKRVERGADKVPRQSRGFSCDSHLISSPVQQKRARRNKDDTQPDEHPSALRARGNGDRDPMRGRNDYFRKEMGKNETKEGLCKRLKKMTENLNTRDTHFVMRLGQLHINSFNEKEVEVLAAEMEAMDELAQEMDDQAEQIEKQDKQLQLARASLMEAGYVCPLLLHPFIPDLFPSSSHVGALAQMDHVDPEYSDRRGITRTTNTFLRHYKKLEDVLEGEHKLCSRPIFTKKELLQRPSLVKARKLWLIRKLVEKHAPALLQQRNASACATGVHPNLGATQTAMRGIIGVYICYHINECAGLVSVSVRERA
jgi:hypothetical protein